MAVVQPHVIAEDPSGAFHTTIRWVGESREVAALTQGRDSATSERIWLDRDDVKRVAEFFGLRVTDAPLDPDWKSSEADLGPLLESPEAMQAVAHAEDERRAR